MARELGDVPTVDDELLAACCQPVHNMTHLQQSWWANLHAHQDLVSLYCEAIFWNWCSDPKFDQIMYKIIFRNCLLTWKKIVILQL